MPWNAARMTAQDHMQCHDTVATLVAGSTVANVICKSFAVSEISWVIGNYGKSSIRVVSPPGFGNLWSVHSEHCCQAKPSGQTEFCTARPQDYFAYGSVQMQC
jgi:hypothetical protein